MRLLKGIVAIFAMTVIVILAIQNIEPITRQTIVLRLNLIEVEWHTEPIPLGAVIVVCFLAGVFVMGIWYLRNDLQTRRRLRVLQKEMKTHRVPHLSYETDYSGASAGDADEEERKSPS